MISCEYDITEDQAWIIVDDEKIGPFSVSEGGLIYKELVFLAGKVTKGFLKKKQTSTKT